MAGENAENKVEWENTSHLDTELTQLKSQLEKQKGILKKSYSSLNSLVLIDKTQANTEAEKIAQNIAELERRIAQLEWQKSEVIQDTEKNLWDSKPTAQQQVMVETVINNASLSDSEKRKVENAVTNNPGDFFSELLAEWGILWMLAALFKNLLWNKDEYDYEYDGDLVTLKWIKLLEDKAFVAKLKDVCENIKANPEDLIKVMFAESWLNPQAKNRLWSWATWLIQFMPKTAAWLGTSVEKIRKMSAVDQLDLVEKYFLQLSNGKPLYSLEELYKVVFFPAAVGKSDGWIFEAPWVSAEAIKRQNWVIAKYSTRPDWYIDWYAFRKYVQEKAGKFQLDDTAKQQLA